MLRSLNKIGKINCKHVYYCLVAVISLPMIFMSLDYAFVQIQDDFIDEHKCVISEERLILRRCYLTQYNASIRSEILCNKVDNYTMGEIIQCYTEHRNGVLYLRAQDAKSMLVLKRGICVGSLSIMLYMLLLLILDHCWSLSKGQPYKV